MYYNDDSGRKRAIRKRESRVTLFELLIGKGGKRREKVGIMKFLIDWLSVYS